MWMPCKRYVKRWLLRRYGRPDRNWPELVNLGGDKPLYRIFVSHLRRAYRRYDTRACARQYPTQVAVEITEDVFRRYGWELTATELSSVNAILEARVKQQLHAYVIALSTTGMPLNECIRQWRRRTGITDDDWSSDSIRKEITRHIQLPQLNLWEEFCKKIEENVWCNLTRTRTQT